jgi:hypothetical protein
VLSQVESKCHVTLAELTAGLAERGLKVHPGSIGRFLQREHKSFKKNPLLAEQKRPKLVRWRAQWLRYQPRIDPTRLVFIDETSVKTNNIAPRRGWGTRCERLVAHVPYGGHWKP